MFFNLLGFTMLIAILFTRVATTGYGNLDLLTHQSVSHLSDGTRHSGKSIQFFDPPSFLPSS